MSDKKFEFITHKDEISLKDLSCGEWGIIKRIKANGHFRKRLMEMGFLNDTPIYVEKCAPLNDPIEYIIKGYHISLRRAEAAHIIVSRQGETHGRS